MGYTNRTIRLAFDGTDDAYPMLGEDIWVVIQNPMLMPMNTLQSTMHIEADENGRPKDPEAAARASLETITKLIVDWNVYDPADVSDDPAPLSLPATVDKVELLPLAIVQPILEIAGKALNRK